LSVVLLVSVESVVLLVESVVLLAPPSVVESVVLLVSSVELLLVQFAVLCWVVLGCGAVPCGAPTNLQAARFPHRCILPSVLLLVSLLVEALLLELLVLRLLALPVLVLRFLFAVVVVVLFVIPIPGSACAA